MTYRLELHLEKLSYPGLVEVLDYLRTVKVIAPTDGELTLQYSVVVTSKEGPK
jgi:hypothetical protein